MARPVQAQIRTESAWGTEGAVRECLASLPGPLAVPLPGILPCRGYEVVLHLLGSHLGHEPGSGCQRLLDCQDLQHSRPVSLMRLGAVTAQ